MSIETDVRQAILQELKTVNQANCPEIFAMMKTENGYTYIESLIIEKCINTGFNVAQAIPHIEQQMQGL